MSSESEKDHIDGKRIKLEDNYEKITSFDITCRNSTIFHFKNKCMKFFTKQLEVKNVQAYKTLNHTGKIIEKVFRKFLLRLIFCRLNVRNSKVI